MTTNPEERTEDALNFQYDATEIIIGIVSAVGTEYTLVTEYLSRRLKQHDYIVKTISISKDVIGKLTEPNYGSKSEVERINHYMNLGNQIREDAQDDSILAIGAASEIHQQREKDEKGKASPTKRTAYILTSLKHPDEVDRLREIYTGGFYVIGIAEAEKRRIKNLLSDGQSGKVDVLKLIKRDQEETDDHGQHTRDCFQLADFFVNIDGVSDKTKADIHRIIGLIFGNPYLTPTFDEYAMFMAFTSALRSADLSRQVGAVIARNNEILASGANDCPRAGGGLYWPKPDVNYEVSDHPNGRDYTRGIDSNKDEQSKIIQNILEQLPAGVDKKAVETALYKSKLKDITEYGRIVHAEMEALLFCARNSITARKADIYCTTFPCHNCAKHIIAAGIDNVIYIEPYPKSKAFDFYNDAISDDLDKKEMVTFKPFVGVGPRRFFDLFSINLSNGRPIKRKEKGGKIITYDINKSNARLQMLPFSYLEKEEVASALLKSFIDSKAK